MSVARGKVRIADRGRRATILGLQRRPGFACATARREQGRYAALRVFMVTDQHSSSTFPLRKIPNMKCLMMILVLGCIAAAASAQELIPASPKSVQPPAPKTDEERGAYAVGLDIGRMLRSRQLDDIDLVFLLRGIKDAVSGAKPALDEKEIQETMRTMQKKALSRVSTRNRTEGEKFLAANAKKEGVKTTKSGLQYKVLKEGTGPSPKATDMVRTHYQGNFINGEIFDSSGGEPIEFAVNGVIAGWTEALQLMKVGSKWQLFVPYKLAYGESGDRGIPPYATLVFEVELLDIVKSETKRK
jgi:FKBP-type peptidyl-prolyl cis-trans isomerase FklB